MPSLLGAEDVAVEANRAVHVSNEQNRALVPPVNCLTFLESPARWSQRLPDREPSGKLINKPPQRPFSFEVSTMGAVVAILVARKERDLVALFKQSRVTSSAKAQSLVALGVQDDAVLRRLRNRAVIREGAPGVYYLDEPSWDVLNQFRHRMVVVVLLLALATAIIALVAIRGQPSS